MSIQFSFSFWTEIAKKIDKQMPAYYSKYKKNTLIDNFKLHRRLKNKQTEHGYICLPLQNYIQITLYITVIITIQQLSQKKKKNGKEQIKKEQNKTEFLCVVLGKCV